MSKLTELADQEAPPEEPEEEAAEDDETPAEPSTEPQPEPEPQAQADEKAGEKLGKENDRHVRAVARIMGDDFALVHPCVCEGFGFTFEAPSAAPEYAHAPDTETCQACNGLGEVLTGARNPHNERRACQTCSGQGYVMVATPLAQVASIGAPAEPYPGYGVAFVPVPGGIEDGWHRPAGHPQWGLDPAQIAPTGTP